jgi:RNA-directed DNA polymerase
MPPETGVPHGGTVSPVLANRFLHPVVDAWCERDVRPRMQGHGCLSRCADDLVMGCAEEADARKMMAILPKRCARFGLRMHPTTTAVRACRQPEAGKDAEEGNGPCDFLGCTPSWPCSRRGCGVRKRRTARQRLRRTTKTLWRWCQDNRQAPVPSQYQRLGLNRRGHLRSSGMRGNCRVVEEVRRSAAKAWWYGWSRRRSQPAMSWEQCQRRLQPYVRPTPKSVHTI